MAASLREVGDTCSGREETPSGWPSCHVRATEKHRALTREIGVPELFMQRGHLHVYPDQKALDKDAASWLLRKQHGFGFERLDRAGIVDLEPHIGKRYQVGIFMGRSGDDR